MLLSNELKPGDAGEAVEELQRLLIAWGSKEQPVIIDGEFGTATKNAVIRFQSEHDLPIDGNVYPDTLREIYLEPSRHLFPFESYPCVCGQCGGFGHGQFEGVYREGKPRIEMYNMYEYPGLDRCVFWAITGLMHRAGIDKISITSGYRCHIYNGIKNRSSTNHMGKAVDWYSKGPQHNWNRVEKIECDECARIRRIGIDDCGFQGGWSSEGRISFELPSHGAYTWIHIDSRMIPRKYRQHVKTLKELIEGPI